MTIAQTFSIDPHEFSGKRARDRWHQGNRRRHRAPAGCRGRLCCDDGAFAFIGGIASSNP
jgi:hypothetical protein